MPSLAATQPQPARGGRHVGWILGGAIVVLVAIFGGTQVFRSKPTAAVNSAVPTTVTQPTPQPSGAPAVVPPAAPASAVPQPHAPKPREGRNAAPPEVAPPAGPSPEEIAAQKKLFDELESETDHLDSRAAAVESSVDALEQQMHSSGLGLRGDMVAARSNLRNDLAKAKQALEGGETDRTRKYLDQATREVEKLESFVGRR
jgi:hypothetical protein